MNELGELQPGGQGADVLRRLIEYLANLARSDAQLSALLREVGAGLLRAGQGVEFNESTAGPHPPGDAATSATAAGAKESAGEPPAPKSRAYRIEDLPPITLGGAVLEPSREQRVPTQIVHGPAVEDLGLIESRCRLKAEACRWQMTRRQLMARGADFHTEIQPGDSEIISRAKSLPDCFLWMCTSNSPASEDPASFEELAGCFELCGDAVGLMRAISGAGGLGEGLVEQAMDLAAEAQSMLRVLLSEFAEVRDSDQEAVFQWLRHKASSEQVLIARYMRLDDPADPANMESLRTRLHAIDSEFSLRQERAKARRSGINKVRYHLKRIGSQSEDDHAHDWAKIGAAVEALLEAGMPTSNVELRDLLVPHVDVIPDEVAGQVGMQRVLTEIDRYLASRPSASDSEVSYQPTPAVQRVSQLLGGRSMVMIGGEARPHAKRAIEEAFGLRELIWMKTREHNPRMDFDPDVSRADVAVVLLAIRWPRHSYGDVKTACDKFDKPLVYLKAGYNPAQVAEHILEQCSERLERDSPA